MIDDKPAHPALYSLADGEGRLNLHFLECANCQTLSFPSSAYGCRQCGAPAEMGQVVSRAGQAVLRTAVTVHVDLHPALKAPYVVGELELAPGVVEEAILTVEDDQGLIPGMMMQAVAKIDPTQPNQFFCRFQPLPHIETTNP